MGLKLSPYLSIRYVATVEEFSRGDREDKSNPFQQDRVMLNLPCFPSFNVTMPCTYKWSNDAQWIAGDLVSFVDDLRVTGNSM